MNNEQKEQMIKTNAFDGVSFDPEKRLERFISDIESEDNIIEEYKLLLIIANIIQKILEKELVK